MDIIKMARELGAAIQQDERYLNFKKAREANEADKPMPIQNQIGRAHV